jgi:hypothetical protein
LHGTLLSFSEILVHQRGLITADGLLMMFM